MHPRTKRTTARPRTSVRATVAGLGLAAALLVPGAALASPAGDLDPSFDRDGRRLLIDLKSASEVLVQKDGKLLVVGESPSGDFRVVRLTSEGARDAGFGTEGVAVADFGGDERAYAAALQPDGKIVVAGDSTTQSARRPAVARFTSDGAPDPAFDPGGADGDGRKLLTGTAIDSDIKGLLVQPDGKLVLAGMGYSNGKYDMTVVRLTRAGAVDGTTFARGVFTAGAYVKAAALTAEGDVVVAGDTGDADRSRIALARFGPDGELVDTFGKAGTKAHDSGQNELVTAVLEQPDGKLVVTGTTGTAEQQMAATRFDRAGELDRSFGVEGRALPGFDGLSGGLDAALQPDGKIVMAGIAGPPYDFAIARLGAGGKPDPSFGTGGRATVDFSGIEAATAITLQPDGRVVVAGVSQELGVPMARLQADPPPVQDPGTGSGSGSGGQQGGGGADTTAPALGRVTLAPARFAVARGATAVSAARRGTSIRYGLSEPAKVTLRIEKLAKGKRRTLGTLRRTGAAGANRVRFSGRIARRALRPGRYRLTVRATDSAGNRSAARSAAFRIVR